MATYELRRPMNNRAYVGSRLRQLRSERGLSQVALAQTLRISASYLNQIEHDARPLTASVLARITEAFGVDGGFFDSQDDVRLVAELREALLDDDIEAAPTTADPQEIAAMVSAHRWRKGRGSAARATALASRIAASRARRWRV
mgnify:CR=1 FL=1